MAKKPANHCLNCQTVWQGPYCHGCGQKRPAARLTMPSLLRDLFERLVNLEQGLLRTFVGLLVRPGHTIQAYLDGQRKKISHPFAFLLVATTLSVLSTYLFGSEFWAEFRETVALGAEQRLNPEQLERFKAFWVALFGFMPYWMLAFSFPSAVLLRAFFPSRDRTLAELWVATLYAVGLAIFIDVPVTMILVFSQVSMPLQMLVTQFLIVAAQVWVLGRFLGRNFGCWLRVVLGVLIAVVLSAALGSFAAFTYAYWPVG